MSSAVQAIAHGRTPMPNHEPTPGVFAVENRFVAEAFLVEAKMQK